MNCTHSCIKTDFHQNNICLCSNNMISPVNEERIAQLNKLNFEWVGKHPSAYNKTKPPSDSVRYGPMVKVLAEFKDEHGHLKVHSLANDWKRRKAKPSKVEYRALPKFVSFLRNEHDLWREGKPSSLDEEKVRHLTELGLEWKKPGKRCFPSPFQNFEHSVLI